MWASTHTHSDTATQRYVTGIAAQATSSTSTAASDPPCVATDANTTPADATGAADDMDSTAAPVSAPSRSDVGGGVPASRDVELVAAILAPVKVMAAATSDDAAMGGGGQTLVLPPPHSMQQTVNTVPKDLQGMLRYPPPPPPTHTHTYIHPHPWP